MMGWEGGGRGGSALTAAGFSYSAIYTSSLLCTVVLIHIFLTSSVVII